MLGIISVYLVRIPFTRDFGYKVNEVSSKLYGTLGGVIKYENPYKPKDKEGGFPKGTPHFLKRLYEFIPGFFMWLFLLAPFIFAIFRWNQGFAIYIALLVAYWSLRTVKFVVGIAIGLKRMKKETSTDWVQKINDEIGDESKGIRLLYLCPVYSESLEVLEPTFSAWSKSDIGADRIDVVMAIEERKKDLQEANFKHLKEKYGKKFGSMQYYIHPAGIEGEVAGVKGANINWACRHFVEDLEKSGKDIANYLVVTCDSDLRPHPKYLSAVLYKYLNTEDRNNTYYATAVHTFNNNIWRVPPLIRAQSNMLTLVLLQNWVVDKFKRIPFLGERIYVRDTFLLIIVNLKTLKEFEFWDPEIANDDTRFLWNAMVRSNGTFKSQEVYIPYLQRCCRKMKTFVKSHIFILQPATQMGMGFCTMYRLLWHHFSGKTRNPSLQKSIYVKKISLSTKSGSSLVVFVLTFGLTHSGVA